MQAQADACARGGDACARAIIASDLKRTLLSNFNAGKFELFFLI